MPDKINLRKLERDDLTLREMALADESLSVPVRNFIHRHEQYVIRDLVTLDVAGWGHRSRRIIALWLERLDTVRKLVAAVRAAIAVNEGTSWEHWYGQHGQGRLNGLPELHAALAHFTDAEESDG